MTTQSKLRYPAAVFRFLRRYPIRHCEHCGKQLTPHLKDGNKLETRQNFEKRKTCDKTCWSAMMAVKRQVKREERAKTSPLREHVQDFEGDLRGLEEVQSPGTSPLELPTLTDPAYGDPPAPEEVAEELEPKPDVVAEKPSMAASSPKDPCLNHAVRPVKLPSKEPFKSTPVPPPRLQAKLPNPRPAATPFTVLEGEVIERGDFGTCPNEGCGKRLNAFGRCGPCEQRKHWLKGQRAKVGAA